MGVETAIVIISLLASAVSLVIGIVAAHKAGDTPFSSVENEQKNLVDIRRIEMSEGLCVPIIYGSSEIGGNIIWWDYSQYDPTHYQVKVWLTLAQGVCVKSYGNDSANNWIMVDGKYFKSSNIDYILRTGLNNTKLPQKVAFENVLDSLPDIGKYASGLKELAHIFIYKYILEEYAKYIPLFTFKIKRVLNTPIINQEIYKAESFLIFDADMLIEYTFSDIYNNFVVNESFVKVAMDRTGKYRLLSSSAKTRGGFAFTAGYLWLSVDYGVTYTKVYPGKEAWTSVAISKSGHVMLATISESYPKLSLDFGTTWNTLVTPLGINAQYSCCAIDENGSTFLIGAMNGAIAITHHYGSVWYPSVLSGYQWWDLACSDDGQVMLGAALDRTDIAKSTDGGTTWGVCGTFTEPCGICMDSYGVRFYAIDYSLKRVYASYNSGISWVSISDDIECLSCIRCDDTGKLIVVSQRADSTVGVLGRGYFTSSDYGNTLTERFIPGVDNIPTTCCISGNGNYFIIDNVDLAVLLWVDELWQQNCQISRNIFLGHNPVAVIYDLLINQLKKSSSDIDLISFNNAANEMYNKLYSVNMTINQPKTVKEIVDQIQTVYDIYLIKNTEDKYAILFFKDTDISNCKATIYDPDIIDLNFTRKSWDDTFNSFTGTYNPAYEIDTQYPEGVNLYSLNQRSVTVKNDANILLTGNVRSKSIDLSIMGYKPSVENRLKEIMARESYPFSVVSVTVGLKFSFVGLGDIVKISSVDYSINNYFRIIDIDNMEIDKNEFKMTLMELREVLTASL